jgi:malonate transporter and related proteins
MSVALLLLPDFALILLGHYLRRGMHLGDHFWAGLEKLVYFVLFPALLINAISRTRIDLAAAAPLFAAGLAAMATGALLALPARRLFRLKPMVFASQFQCAYRFNSYIGLAVAGTMFGDAGIATMGILVGAMVPFANVASVWMLARHGEMALWREIARNPLIWSTLAGLALNLAGIPLPGVLQHFLARLSDASIALGLLAVGAALKLRGIPGSRAAAAYLGAVKLLAVPAAAWGAASLLGLSGLYLQTVVLFGALPTASSAYILAVRMGGDGPGVAWLISTSTLAAMVTLPLWLSALR